MRILLARMRARWARSEAAGFTLLEIMVALVVLGMLVAGLGEGLRFGTLAWSRQARVADRVTDLDAADRTVRRAIEEIDPGNRHDAPQVRGNSLSVEFTTELPAGLAALPDQRAEVRLLVDPAHRLVLRWAPYRHAATIGPPPAPTDTVLLSGVDHLELAYWAEAGEVGRGSQPGWRPVWQEPAMPGLIRVRLVFPAGSGNTWPDIVVAPQLHRQ